MPFVMASHSYGRPCKAVSATAANMPACAFQIAVQRGMKADMGALAALCEKAENDIRSCINTLQVRQHTGGLLPSPVALLINKRSNTMMLCMQKIPSSMGPSCLWDQHPWISVPVGTKPAVRGPQRTSRAWPEVPSVHIQVLPHPHVMDVIIHWNRHERGCGMDPMWI